MRIALTHNLKLTGSPEEAEFDSPATIDALSEALGRAGHDVERIEVSGPPSRVIARLEALSPDLVFNTAEGHKGKTREAFYPALLDELGFPYTGSDAYTLCVTLDKTLTKRILTGYGIPTPRGRLVTRATIENGALDDITFPVIVKPNFEGSSKGISGDFSVCEDSYQLAQVVDRQLSRFPAGLIVERYLRGIDVSCAFVEGLGHDGLLEPIEYVVDPRFSNLYNVYDFHLKNVRPEHVTLRVAELPGEVLERIKSLSRRIVRAFDLKDMGRCEFRVTPRSPSSQHGYDVHFLEVDALPSLDPSAGLFLAARRSGAEFDDVIRAIVKSACKRRGITSLLESTTARKQKKGLRVGFTFNMKREGGGDAEAEFDSPTTIQAIANAIESYGHTVVPLEAKPDLPHQLMAARPDVVFNIAEGLRGRGRESQVPALCELLGIPYSGSDPTTLSLCLDKGLTKQILRAAGIDTPDWQVLTTGREKMKPFRYPVIVKPNAEGTSKGITSASVVNDEPSARAAAKLLLERYGQPALVEEYIVGREFTVGLLGERRPKVLPPMEVVFIEKKEHPVYGYEEKQYGTSRVRFECPAQLTAAEVKRLDKVARDTFTALGCRDVARIDLRMTKDGTVFVIECNPLPGLTPDFSDLCNIGKVAGMDYRTLIGEILAGCIKRYREQRAAAAPLGVPNAPALAPPPAAPTPMRATSSAPQTSTALALPLTTALPSPPPPKLNGT
ncbi:D-alanine--D-alanine ligase family protein [Polyangium aurulentum]|uniref:D-alanine--D-alanine ligase family protein n=1 Tax=Polyangium aurulentum TaxID=2567896 RepID=UPI0010AEACB8|nr:ATP-grasp domain-containing protein [Polyangium aurulentum]UQA55378.1 ATP-grasp domain-containing protein [Polyangium aurulentum]